VKVKWMCLVNLLGDKEVYPEFPSVRCEADAIAAKVGRWLDDPAAAAEIHAELTSLCRRYAEPGACGRAAEYVLRTLGVTMAERRERAA
jgi:lipid A disaccharide synthetase